MHDLSGQPVPACLGLCHGGHAFGSPARRVGSPGEQERGDVGVQGATGLEMAVILDFRLIQAAASRRRLPGGAGQPGSPAATAPSIKTTGPANARDGAGAGAELARLSPW